MWEFFGLGCLATSGVGAGIGLALYLTSLGDPARDTSSKHLWLILQHYITSETLSNVLRCWAMAELSICRKTISNLHLYYSTEVDLQICPRPLSDMKVVWRRH